MRYFYSNVKLYTLDGINTYMLAYKNNNCYNYIL